MCDIDIVEDDIDIDDDRWETIDDTFIIEIDTNEEITSQYKHLEQLKEPSIFNHEEKKIYTNNLITNNLITNNIQLYHYCFDILRLPNNCLTYKIIYDKIGKLKPIIDYISNKIKYRNTRKLYNIILEDYNYSTNTIYSVEELHTKFCMIFDNLITIIKSF